jgi:polyhydroxybutyrate depolymerase
MENLTGLSSLADREGFIVVYPEALERFWSDRREPRNLTGGQVNDVKFIDQLITTLQNTYNIDPKKVYATGISNGGFMSQVLACDLSDRIAAIASVASNLPVSLSQDCPAKRPVPVMYILGTEDPIVPYEGGEVRGRGDRRGQILSAKDSFDFWVRLNQINTAPRNVSFPDRVNDGTKVELLSAKEGNRAVQLVTIVGGGHTWAGGLQYAPVFIIGVTSQEIDANQTIWRFFSNYNLE